MIELDIPVKIRWIIRIMAIFLILICMILFSSGMQYILTGSATAEKSEAVSFEQSDLENAIKLIKKDIDNSKYRLDQKTPKSGYLVINSSSNEFSLYRGHTVLKKDRCSTGSYILLKNGDQQEWMFKTPKGEFRIQSKTEAPVWRKPDWAFVEEGLPVPSAYHHSRYEYGVLGDYALGLGHGYLIHGTLYQRFLGLPVTHGCIRLGDDNLKLVYQSLNIGSRVYIF